MLMSKSCGCAKLKGGGMASKLFKGKETYGEELKEAKAVKSGKITPAEYAKGEGKEEAKMKSGGKVKKYAKGGMTEGSKAEEATESKSFEAKEDMGPKNMKKDVETGSNKLKKFGEPAVQKRGDTKGKNFGDSGPTRMASGGVTRADGCAQRGKTKGRYL